jgi:hypothetical protein
LTVLVLIEAKGDLRAAHEDRPLDEIRIFHHQVDGFLLRLRQRALLEYRAPRADKVQESVRIDVPFEKRAIRRRLVDVDLLDVDLLLVQETPGRFAGRSGRLPVERRLGHR